jgi:hypothetical protein
MQKDTASIANAGEKNLEEGNRIKKQESGK